MSETIGESVAKAVDDGILSATPVPAKADIEEDDEEPVEDRTALLVRQITDSVTKSIADLLKPSKPEPAPAAVSAEEPARKAKPKAKRKSATFFGYFS